MTQQQEGLGEALTRTENWFEKNSKKMVYVLCGLLALAAVVFAYWQLAVRPRQIKAADMIAMAQSRFESETPDYQLALEGDAAGAGFLQVIEKYGSTATGNLARQYAGICYLRLGELDKASEFLNKYRPVKGVPGALINAQNLTLRGDIAVEQERYDDAIALYEKAVGASHNDLTAPVALRKAALAAQAAGRPEQAEELAERIAVEYPHSTSAAEVEKLVGSFN